MSYLMSYDLCLMSHLMMSDVTCSHGFGGGLLDSIKTFFLIILLIIYVIRRLRLLVGASGFNSQRVTHLIESNRAPQRGALELVLTEI